MKKQSINREMTKKLFLQWMMVAILICGLSVLASCSSDNDDNSGKYCDRAQDHSLKKVFLKSGKKHPDRLNRLIPGDFQRYRIESAQSGADSNDRKRAEECQKIKDEQICHRSHKASE